MNEVKKMCRVSTSINTWLSELWGKGHTIIKFAMGEIAMNDKKDDIIDLTEGG